ncbi:MAG: SH3 domain-containing protein [Lachnospiraceae bacterium]
MMKGSDAEHMSRKGQMFLKHTALLLVFTCMFSFILSGCSSSTKGGKTDGESSVIPITNDSDEVKDAAIELTEEKDSAITELFKTYFNDLKAGDAAALGKIMVNAPDQETVSKEIEYIEDYQNIRCYSRTGLLEGTYVVFVYYEVKFKNIDTLAPSMIREYVCTNEDGALFINNGDVDGEIAAWLDEVQNSDSAAALVADVNNALASAAESDEKLSALIAKLHEGVQEGNGESSAAPETSSPESSQPAETTAAEMTPAETTPAETTAAETKPEVSYTPFDSEKQVTAKVNVFIRKGPSKDAEIGSRLIGGSSVTAVGTDGDWTVVKYSGGLGYILSENLQ